MGNGMLASSSVYELPSIYLYVIINTLKKRRARTLTLLLSLTLLTHIGQTGTHMLARTMSTDVNESGRKQLAAKVSIDRAVKKKKRKVIGEGGACGGCVVCLQ